MNSNAADTSNLPVTLADIQAAASSIAGAVERTPMRPAKTLSAIAGAELLLKFENLQFTASFKERGALNRLLAMSAGERKRGVIAMSRGNHAQGLAYHAKRLGIPTTIVMPEGTSFTKITHTRDFGAKVIIEGASLNEAAQIARDLAAREGLTLVHPYDDPKVIAGQGTVALEMLADMPDLDTLIVPVGGGGLISGMAIAARAIKPDIRIYGVQSALYPSMINAVSGETRTLSGQTIADGIAVKEPGIFTRAIIAHLVTDLLTVREAEIEDAMARLLEIEKTVTEGAGAAALAGVLAHPHLFEGRKVGIVLSGGNVDMRLLTNVILRELAREGRILSLVLTIDDRPGTLAEIATLVGACGGNILEVSHNRLLTGVSATSADLGMVVEARDGAHANEIKIRLAAAGFTVREQGR